MAQGEFKMGGAIEVTYQAPNAATGKTVNMEVYDEAHVIVAGGPTVLNEIGVTGRYYGAFTPDAEGIWTAEVEISDGTGKVVKQYAVAGHDVDSVGDAVATADGKIDALNDLAAADVATELATYDAPTKAEMDAKVDALNDLSTGDIDARLTAYDAATGTEIAALNDLSAADIAGELATYDAPTKAELDVAESDIRGADADTLKTLSDQIDEIEPGSGAMIG